MSNKVSLSELSRRFTEEISLETYLVLLPDVLATIDKLNPQDRETPFAALVSYARNRGFPFNTNYQKPVEIYHEQQIVEAVEFDENDAYSLKVYSQRNLRRIGISKRVSKEITKGGLISREPLKEILRILSENQDVQLRAVYSNALKMLEQYDLSLSKDTHDYIIPNKFFGSDYVLSEVRYAHIPSEGFLSHELYSHSDLERNRLRFDETQLFSILYQSISNLHTLHDESLDKKEDIIQESYEVRDSTSVSEVSVLDKPKKSIKKGPIPKKTQSPKKLLKTDPSSSDDSWKDNPESYDKPESTMVKADDSHIVPEVQTSVTNKPAFSGYIDIDTVRRINKGEIYKPDVAAAVSAVSAVAREQERVATKTELFGYFKDNNVFLTPDMEERIISIVRKL
ncbi:MAG: hypothetical protein HY831_02720 [Candidatus Aenigmarchaeota archaeon]|nr:hypothetical protein [Candidatus Aenigmarchaeota archaeon]